ncbi:MAG: DsbA family protein [Actinobacteria bacterium]|jgi:protein-disulfide isomerase-like protein with CxxC motif|nr:DsbA family protein [Actinomycetota bacterium]
MNGQSFSITYDYLCPFARNANEHVVTALKDGAPWDVHFQPFSLHQAHLEEGEAAIWDTPSRHKDVLALEAGLMVRERYPDRFLDAHLALFAARHDSGRDITDEAVVREALTPLDVDVEALMKAVTDGEAHGMLKKEHVDAVDTYAVFGVPTFIVGDVAAFTRIMTRPGRDAKLARESIQRILDLLTDHPELNEIKQTKVPF